MPSDGVWGLQLNDGPIRLSYGRQVQLNIRLSDQKWLKEHRAVLIVDT